MVCHDIRGLAPPLHAGRSSSLPCSTSCQLPDVNVADRRVLPTSKLSLVLRWSGSLLSLPPVFDPLLGAVLLAARAVVTGCHAVLRWTGLCSAAARCLRSWAQPDDNSNAQINRHERPDSMQQFGSLVAATAVHARETVGRLKCRSSEQIRWEPRSPALHARLRPRRGRTRFRRPAVAAPQELEKLRVGRHLPNSADQLTRQDEHRVEAPERRWLG